MSARAWRAADGALAVVVFVGVARFWTLRDHGVLVDELAGLVTARMLSAGHKLYEGVFSHHMPAEYAAAQAAVGLFGASQQGARLAAALLWALVCGALHLLMRGKPRLAWTAPTFAALTACLAPSWGGNLLLVELYWSSALVLLAALWAEPLGEDPRDFGPAAAAAAGFLLTLAFSCSLAACVPVALFAFGLLRLSSLRRHATWACGGAAVYLVSLGCWSFGRVAWSGWWADAVVFNFRYYAAANGFGGAGQLYARLFGTSLLHWTGLGPGAWSGTEPLFSAAVLAAAVFTWKKSGTIRAAGVLLTLAACRFAVRAPGLGAAPAFHASAYYGLLVLGTAVGLARLNMGAATTTACAAAALWLGVSTPAMPPDARESAAVGVAAARLAGPDGGVLALPSYPEFYLRSGSIPAWPYVLYLPWVAARDGAKAASFLAARPPKVVFVECGAMQGQAWQTGFGAPLLEILKRRYDHKKLNGPYGGEVGGLALPGDCEDSVYVRREGA